MNKITFIFVIATLLLFADGHMHQLNANELFHHSMTPKSLQNYADQKLTPIHDPRIKGVVLSYVFGINTQISKTDRHIHQILNLKHLFSPSGLHISSILFIFLWMNRNKWKNAHYLWNSLILFFFSLSLYLPGYYPLKRTLGFHVLTIGNEIFLKKKNIKVSFFQIFLILMMTDFTFGTYRESPLSFTYSFLFWGIILSVKKFSHRLFYLGLGQLLVCYFSLLPINPLSIMTNMFLSPIFSLLFPLIFFSLFLGFPLVTISLTSIYMKVLEETAKSISFFPSIYVDDVFIFFLILLFCYQNLRLPKKIFLILLFVAIPVKTEKTSSFKDFKKSYINKIKKPPEGGFKEVEEISSI
jgi:hypothetical protein